MRLGFPLFPETASEMASRVDAIYFFGLAVAAIFSVLVAVCILVLATRYRRSPTNQVGTRGTAPVWLEVTWSVLPLAVLMVMFAWGARVFFAIQRAPSDAIEYYVTGKRWMWKFQHPEGTREINHLHVPVGQRIKLIMTSEDVIHSVYLPAFRVKQDVLPGRYTTLWFEALQPGTYRLFCAEYCGVEHSLMGGSIIAMEPSAYAEWLAAGDRGVSAPTAGAALFEARACDSCHRPDSAARAPVLNGVYGQLRALATGALVVADDNYLRESILDPRARVVAGYNPIMPTYQGRVSEDELLQLIAYLKQLEAVRPVEGATP